MYPFLFNRSLDRAKGSVDRWGQSTGSSSTNKQKQLARKRVGGLKLEELPGLEALQVPGTKYGQTIVVREGDNGVAYAWNRHNQTWDKIGEVIDGPDDGNDMKRPDLDGVQYDYDGEPIRKLPYSVDEHNSDSVGMES
ncbi:unnamed protein product [Lactuca virosa]|uniref:PFU domain-containing protein n=1 Tax=Lactuca virosa TaxID=75947 RepID=A0AAU9P2J6_9ASTR|nr:unnamed protein product [Lactuca virosa]